MKAIVT